MSSFKDKAFEMVACIKEELPYSQAAKDFVLASLGLPKTPYADSICVSVCYEVFHATEQIIKGDQEPTALFTKLLQEQTEVLKAASKNSTAFTAITDESFGDVESETGSHYGNLFAEFDSKQYDEAAQLLRDRFERNEFDLDFPKGKKALDAGCGGGRYTVALKKIGFDEVTGLDISKEGVQTAKQRAEKSGTQGVNFVQGSTLEIPFENQEFDFVFSNGVLHHTKDLKGGLKEVLRVLKSGGKGFLYLIEAPGGIFWDVIEILRPLMHEVDYRFAREQFRLMGVPANRRYYILDHIMVPINIRSKPEEVEALLKEAGATNIRRLKRGTDFDRVEQIHHNAPYHKEKFGVGENRYFFEKSS